MTQKTKIEVNLVLPTATDSQDACVKRLTDLLRAKRGIELAHLDDAKDQAPHQICIHYDPTVLSITDVRELAKRAGLEVEKRFGHLVLQARSMHARQLRSLEFKVRKLGGVLEARISPAGILSVEYDQLVTSETALKPELIKLVGQTPSSDRGHGHSIENSQDQEEHLHNALLGEKAELYFTGISGILLCLGWALSLTNVAPWAPWSLFLAAFFFGGVLTFREAIENLIAGRFEIDFLMLVAAIGAAVLGKWFEGALLLFLFSLGHSLEHYAMARAKKAIESLAELAPRTATVLREGKTAEVKVEELLVGDEIIVKPNERIPADGFVTKGTSSVNQAPITGESIPVDKQPVEDLRKAIADSGSLGSQNRVFAGTINGLGSLEIRVTKMSNESTLSRVVQMVSEADAQKSPTQLFTDKFELYFVPVTLTFVVFMLFAWLVIDEPFSASFYRSMSVLVAASPCALAISTPSAILSGVARAARAGVLVKGGAPLESLGGLRAIAFDKTGTLTEGNPHLTDVLATSDASEEALLRVAMAVEKLSDHPLASAVVKGGQQRLKVQVDLTANNVEGIVGLGVKGTVDGETVYIGKEKLFSDIQGPGIPEELHKSITKLKADGRTTMIVRKGESYLGVLGLMDTPREAAKQVIARLRELGIQRMIMLSGDNQQVANSIAKEVGIDEAFGDLMPDDKVESIKILSNQEGVAMVGDGVNDAPAMANATVGIAMGAAGSDVALETADIALMADDLSKLPFAIGLSRKTSAIIRQNLWFSLGMVAFLVPATVLGLQMGSAVLLHEGSTLIVVFNALRLLAYEENWCDTNALFSKANQLTT